MNVISFEPDSQGRWYYNGFACWIEQDIEPEEVCKNWHYYIAPGSDKAEVMPLSPYVGEEAMVAWIRAGCPKHPRNGNFGYDRKLGLYP